MNRVHMIRKIFLALSMVAAMLAGSSCENGLIFEGEGDCGVYYRIRFKYDYNIKFADAFALLRSGAPIQSSSISCR